MNYHLMVDDKFIDGLITDAEKASPGKNTYIVEGNRATAKYVTHPLIVFVNSLEAYLEKLKTILTENDKVFIHWLQLYEKFLLRENCRC